jgi:hypothetical protein
MLDPLIVAYTQFVVMLIELEKVLSQEIECLYSKTTTVLSEWTIPNSMNVSLLYFYCITNKCVVEKCMYAV